MKSLIIAEKPSVTNDIAKALGGFTKHDDYYENDAFIIASAVGHLLEIIVPEAYDVKRGKWSFTHLPIIPPHFDLNPIDKTKSKLATLKKLIKRKDVTALINACDAGREGELIFRYIVQHCNAKQPISRLWLQSMTPQAIRDGFKQLRTDQQMAPLADAARCRSEADWLVGINGTRAMTAFNSKEGGFFLTTVGRVQTPTLSLVVEREEKIRKFISRDYWEIHAEFKASQGTYKGRWFDAQFKKDEQDPERKAERLWHQTQAQDIVDACQHQVASVKEESKPATQLSPMLFDLTSLQREANAKFGFSAKNTLGLAQALYEKHKVLTYPRTDSRHLPEDYLNTVKQTLEMINGQTMYRSYSSKILNNGWVKPNKRIFDNKKISDHFAIIPTLQAPKALSEPEQKLYDLVLKRFLAVFYPAAEHLVTTRITRIETPSIVAQFKTEGKVLVKPGWLEIYGKESQEEDANLTPIQAGEQVITQEIHAQQLVTKPPARYSEATLLSAMEGAGKFVEDEELRAAMDAKGLGTPATRAAIIEGLLTEKYLVREGRELIPTSKAFQLLTLLRGLAVEELTSAELTGEWEYKLSQIEQGNLTRTAFMQEIANMTQKIVARAKEYNNDTIPGDYAHLTTPCPSCGGKVHENYRRFACEQCEFSITKIPGGRAFEIDEVETLLKEGSIGPLQGFRSKMGRPFVAILKLTAEHKLEFDFGQAQEDNTSDIDFSSQTPVGPCPKCKHNVYEHGLAYLCEKAIGQDKTCDYRSGKVILQQEIYPEQMHKLLTQGRTDLLTSFKSARTGRLFKAHLVLNSEGKTGFEFEKSDKKPRANKASSAKSDEVASSTDTTNSTTANKKPARKSTKTVGTTKASAKKSDKATTSTKAPVTRKRKTLET